MKPTTPRLGLAARDGATPPRDPAQRAEPRPLRAGLVTRNFAALVTGKPRAREGHQDVLDHCWQDHEARTFLQAAKGAGAQWAAFFALALDSGNAKGRTVRPPVDRSRSGPSDRDGVGDRSCRRSGTRSFWRIVTEPVRFSVAPLCLHRRRDQRQAQRPRPIYGQSPHRHPDTALQLPCSSNAGALTLEGRPHRLCPMRDFVAFLKAVFWHGGSPRGAALTIGGLAWQLVTWARPETPSPGFHAWVVWSAGLFLTFFSAFRAWSDEHHRRESAQLAFNERRLCQPILRFAETRWTPFYGRVPSDPPGVHPTYIFTVSKSG